MKAFTTMLENRYKKRLVKSNCCHWRQEVLSAFVTACEFEDATKKWKVPNKGTVSDVNKGKNARRQERLLF
jgi:hypothetical protein